jgi:tetratricopeptide (TPR) repeat protein
LSNLAMLYRTTGRPDQADAPLQEALKAAQDAGSTGVVAGIRAQMGLLARDRNAADQAEAHFLAALELDKQVEAPLAVASDLEELGRLYAAMNRWPEAARELDRAIQLRATLGQVEKVRDLYEALKQTKEKGGQPASLAPYDRLLKNLDDAPPRSPLCR